MTIESKDVRRATTASEEVAGVRRYLSVAIARASPGWPREVIEELAQAGVVRLMELEQRRPISGGYPPAYLSRVAYTLVVDEIRRRRRESSLDSDETSGWVLRSWAPTPEKHTVMRELGRAIFGCVGKLSANRRHAVQLMLLGHTNVEIAARVGWDHKQTENFVTRGRSELRKCLQKLGFGP